MFAIYEGKLYLRFSVTIFYKIVARLFDDWLIKQPTIL